MSYTTTTASNPIFTIIASNIINNTNANTITVPFSSIINCNSSTTAASIYTNSVMQNMQQLCNPPPLPHSAYLPSFANHKLRPGQEYSIELPDGAILKVDDKGNYKLLDDDAKVTYQANRMREFNRYINASDLLEDFIKFIATLKLTKSEFMKLPIELFIAWLILESAKKDGEEPDQEAEIKLIEYKKNKQPRCNWCGKWISRIKQKHNLFFCNSIHYEKQSTKLAIG